MADPLGTVALLSLEPWDEVWRRNQHFASRLVSTGVVDRLLFVTPPAGGLSPRAARHVPVPGIEVVTPPLLVPRRFGGHHVIARWLRRRLRAVDLVWVNDPVAGRGVASLGVPFVYDVTDDWRSMPQRAADRAAIVAAEDHLAGRAHTVVCSDVLAERWRARYGVDPVVVHNGVDVGAIRAAAPRHLGPGRHAVYVGTVHANRLDVALVEAVARDGAVTVHLVGPDHLDAASRQRLLDAGAVVHGSVPSAEVPGWLVAADVLICPHVVDEFTLSLDAIKAHEYLATRRPIVATPSCGFQSLAAPGLTVAGAADFVTAVRSYLGSAPFDRPAPASWDDRAAEFGDALAAAR